MNAKIFFVLAAVCLAQVAVAEKPAEPIQIDALLAKAQDALAKMGAEVQKSIGIKELPDAQEVAKNLMAQSQAFATKVGAMVNDLQKEITEHPDISSVASAVAKRLNQTVQDLQSQAPAIKDKATQLQAQLKTATETLVTESQKLVNAFSGEMTTVQSDINKITKNALDAAIDVAAKLGDAVKKNMDAPNAGV